MKKLCMNGASLLLALLALSACEGNKDNYPDEYVGFDKIIENYTLAKKAEQQDISIKIIAAEKKNNDREVTLSGKQKPDEKTAYEILEPKVVIAARKKSTTARIRIYPKLIKKSQDIRIICSPKDKDVKQSQLTLKVTVK